MTKQKKKTAARRGNFRRRAALGLILIAVAVALGFALSWMIGDDSTVWQRTAYVTAVCGLGMGGLLYIFIGWTGIAVGIAIPIFISMQELLPRPWSILVYLAFIALLCALPKVLQRRKKKADMDEVQGFILDDPDLASTVFVHRPFNDRIYQLIMDAGELRAYCVGDNIRGLNFDKLLSIGDDLRPQGKRDLFIAESDVEKLRFETPENTMYTLRVKLRAGEKSYNFVPFATADETLLDFLRDFAVNAQSDPDRRLARQVREQENAQVNPRRIAVLRAVLVALMCIAIGAQACWLFLDVPYELFAVLSLIPTPAVLLLYLLFPNELSISENRVRVGKRVSVIGMLLGPSFAPIIRTINDFNFLEWSRLLMISGIFLLTLMAAVLVLTREWRGKPSLLLGIAFALAFYLPALTGQVNVLLDFAVPAEITAPLIDKEVHINTRSPDRYVFTLDIGDGEVLELNVSRWEYNKKEIGDSLYVSIFPGRLGIPYAEVYWGIV